MERKKRSKGRGWESCYVKTIYGTFGVEMRAYGQKLVQFCTHTHTRVSFSSIDRNGVESCPGLESCPRMCSPRQVTHLPPVWDLSL